MEIITLNQAAEFLGFSRDYLRKIMRKEAIPYVQLKRGGKIQFVKQDLEDWVLSSRKPMSINLKLKKLKMLTREIEQI